MISNTDKTHFNTRRQIRCINCQHYGHIAKNCPQPPSSKRCHMCGVEGHHQPRCPNKICLLVSFHEQINSKHVCAVCSISISFIKILQFNLQCGEKSQKFTHGCVKCNRDRDRFCYECRQKGHRQNLCPDKWRRYHSTVRIE